MLTDLRLNNSHLKLVPTALRAQAHGDGSWLVPWGHRLRPQASKGCKACGCRLQGCRLQGCSLQGCRQQVVHCKVASENAVKHEPLHLSRASVCSKRDYNIFGKARGDKTD